MTNYRLFLLGFVSASFIFLSGFDHSVDHHLPTQQDTKKPHTVKHPNTGITDKTRINDDKELQRPLDLTLPINNTEKAEESEQTNDRAQSAVDTLFAPKPKKEEQPLQLKGGWLMSPEPETEKRKSVDGAGIVIDLKP